MKSLKRNLYMLCLIAGLLSFVSLYAQDKVYEELGTDDKISGWKGFSRYDFKFEQQLATIIPCTLGPQSREGHHFPIETPRIAANFIKYHTWKPRLSSSEYHCLRKGLKNSLIRFERERKARVAFLGGSITKMSGWRDSICLYLEKRFPDTEFEFIPAGIGSRGSTAGAFRLVRDVLSKGRVDLLFQESAVNDRGLGRDTTEQTRAVEGIVRHARRANPAMDIVIMHFVDEQKMETYRNGNVPAEIRTPERVAIHYHIPTIHLAKEVTDRINNGEFNWEDDFRNLHPSPFGQGVYASSIRQFLDLSFTSQICEEDVITPYPLPERLDQFCFESGILTDVSDLDPSGEWYMDPEWEPADSARVRPILNRTPMLIGEGAGTVFTCNFKGNAVGIVVAAGPDAGIIEYRVDNGEWNQQNLFTGASRNLHLGRYFTLASGLAGTKHKLEIRLTGEKDERSTGHACRIRYFYVNQILQDII